MQALKRLSIYRNIRSHFSTFCTVINFKQILLLAVLLSSSIIINPSFGQNTELDPVSNSSSLGAANNAMMEPINQLGNMSMDISQIENLTAVAPETLIVLPEQIQREKIIFSIAAIYNNTSAVFLINNTTILEKKITIEAFSVNDYGNHTDYTIQSAQVVLNDLPVGKYELEIKDRLTGLSLYDSSFYIRPFAELFNEDGVAGRLETYRGGLVDDTMYLVPSLLNPVCAPSLSNYTNVWANSTDRFFLGINVSTESRDISNISLSLDSGNVSLLASPTNSSLKLLNNSSSILMLFDMASSNLDVGVYNLTYHLNYSEGSSDHSLKGILNIGIYRINMSYGANDTVNVDLITPFKDHINQSAGEWADYLTIDNVHISLPNRVSYNGTYSNFTLQEPKSPWIHALVCAGVGSIVGATIDIYHQKHKCETAGKTDCNIDWASVAYRAAEGGVAGASLALLGPTALQTVLVSGGISGGVSAGTEAATQLITTGGIYDYKEIAFSASQDAIHEIAWNGAAKIAGAYVAVQRGLQEGLYQKGSWEKIGELGKSTHIMDRIKAGTKYLERAHKLSRATDILMGFEKAKENVEKIEDAYSEINSFEDTKGIRTVETSGKLIGSNSPIVDENGVKEYILENSLKGNPQGTGPSSASNSAKTSQIISGPTSLVKPLEFILVLDESGSMGCEGNLSESKIRMVKDTAKNLVDFAQIYGNIFLGVVTFASSSSVESDLSLSSSDLKSQIEGIRESSCIDGGSGSGGTSFGYGLQEALLLFDNSRLNGDKAIIFMSDGQHNQLPDPQTFVEICKDRNIPIFTIGFGPDVNDSQLRTMADQTGGTYSYSDSIIKFENDMINAFDLGAGWKGGERFEGTVSQGETKDAGTFSIPSSTDSAKVMLNWPGSNLDLIIIDPNGKTINGSDPSIVYSGENSKPKYIIIQDPIPGNWSIKVQGLDVPEGYTNYTVAVNELAEKSAMENRQLPAKELLYSDDFSDPKSGWPRYGTQDVSYSYDKNQYHISIVPDDEYFESVNDKRVFRDFVMEVKADKNESSNEGRYGVIFRRLDKENFYRFSISSNGYYKFDGKKDGSWFTIIDWTKSNVIKKDYSSNLLQITAESNKYAFYINGIKVADAFDRSISSGSIGLFGETTDSGNELFNFDDLKVWSIIPGQPYGDISVGDVIYSENFSVESPYWPEYSTPNESYSYDSGRYILTVIPEGSTSISAFDEENFSNFIIEAEAAMEDGEDPCRYGVVFRYMDQDNFYRFIISSKGYFKFDGKKNGSWFTTIDWTESDAINAGRSSNIIQVSADGEEFAFYINGLKVANAFDCALSSGCIGITAVANENYGNVQISFDNLIIWSPSPVTMNPEIGDTGAETKDEGISKEITNNTVLENELTIQLGNESGQLPAKDLLYSESFSNPKCEWPRYSTANQVFAYYNGRYDITVLPDNWYSLETYKEENYTDFVMAVEAAKAEGPEPSYYGIVLRYIDEDNFYKFYISSNGKFKFDGKKDGSWFTIIDWTKSDLIRTADASNTIQVVAEGGRFTFYINGIKVAYAFDSNFGAGRIGVVGQTDDDGGAHVSFDNLNIWSIIPYRPFGSLSVGDILYSCEFTDIGDGWSNESTENVSYYHDGGQYRIDILPENAQYYAIHEEDEFGDFAMEVEAAKVEGYDSVGYGTLLRYIDDSNFYRFEVFSNGYFKFDGKKDGSWFTVIDWTKSDAIYTDESTNIIQAVAEDDRFTFYINDVKVAEAYDSTFTSGKIGLIAESSEDHGNALASFDNLKVWSTKK